MGLHQEFRMTMEKTKKKSNKGKIIKNYQDFISIDDVNAWREIPRRKDQGSGIYALYNNYGLYYVGLTSGSLGYRIRKHTRDRHAGKWNRYSWYQIKKIGHVKDIETILLRLTNPPGNKIKGRVGKRKRERLDTM